MQCRFIVQKPSMNVHNLTIFVFTFVCLSLYQLVASVPKLLPKHYTTSFLRLYLVCNSEENWNGWRKGLCSSSKNKNITLHFTFYWNIFKYPTLEQILGLCPRGVIFNHMLYYLQICKWKETEQKYRYPYEPYHKS